MQKPIFHPKRIVTSALVALGMLLASPVMAQNELQYVGELGFSVGGAQYFGDLNTRGALNTIKPTVGIFYRKYLNDYVGVRAHLRYSQLGYSDVYSKNEFERRRNLSFNTHVVELDLQGDFNFFRFEPGSLNYRFSPYFTGGLGLFHFDPYAYLDGKKYNLQPLRTEGQGSAQYPDRKPYGLISYSFLLGGGFKYNLSRSVNLGLEVLYRFTGTDYLDDVSKTYAGAALFPPKANGENTVAYLLQDRSWATGPDPIGVAGRQRGNSRDKDQFVSVEFTISILFTTYKCKF
jgi:opacity protein-like surface antigen